MGAFGLTGEPSNTRPAVLYKNGAVAFQMDDAGDSGVTSSSNQWLALDYGIWVHYSVVVDSVCKTVTIYRNGIAIESIGIDDTSYSQGQQIRIGGSNMQLSQLAVYNRALSMNDISNIVYARSYSIVQQIFYVALNSSQVVNLATTNTDNSAMVAFGTPTIQPPETDNSNCIACGCNNNQTCCPNSSSGTCTYLQDSNNCGFCGNTCTGSGICCCTVIPCICTDTC